jgi:hypothetical protein
MKALTRWNVSRRNMSRWYIVAAVVWAALVSGLLIFGILNWEQSAGSGVNSGMTLYESDGLTPIAIAVAPLVWVVVTAAVAWAAARYRSFALSVLAGVLALILGTLCAATLLAVFTPIPLIGLAFGVSAALLLLSVFLDRAAIRSETQRPPLSEMPPPNPTHVTTLPSTPSTPTAP